MKARELLVRLVELLRRPEVQVALVAAIVLAKSVQPDRIEPIEGEPSL